MATNTYERQWKENRLVEPEVAGDPPGTQCYANITSSSEATKDGTAFAYSHCANRQGPGKDVTTI